ncbi:MAG: TolC family protein, partial [Bacteroidales bacterium]|nr:TolC family protein [Bacteroidales bacterium]
QLKTQQKSVELANQNYAVVSNRYKNDMALITDMLDASNAQLSAEVQLSNARINIVFNYFKLLYISGTLSESRF